MRTWIIILAFVLFIGFSTAIVECVYGIRKQKDIVIRSRLHKRVNGMEVILANFALVLLAVILHFGLYEFVPANLVFVVFIVLSTRVKSGITNDGILIDTNFVEWDAITGYKLLDDLDDSNVIVLKIKIKHKQYILVCDRENRKDIKAMMEIYGVPKTITKDTREEDSTQ